MAEMTLALSLKAKDGASRVMQSARNNVNQATKSIENQATQSGVKQQAAVRKTAQVTEQSYRQMQQAARVVARDRESLGVRSENVIQREINQTIAAYQRLKASGSASARELARAAEMTRAKVASLNAEMGKTTWGQRLGNVGRGMAGIGAGVMAGAMVMSQPMKKEMDYDRRLAMVSNTAFSDRDVAGRIAGKDELNQAVKTAVETGGGSKEEALGALDTLLASGTVKAETAMKLLPTLQKAAVATGADTNDLAKIAISSMQQFDISEDQIGAVLDKAVAAGQAGNFELSDMARWLPQQMAAAKSAGLSGMSGFEALLVANQQARVTAGTSDEAGNNLVNLLAKITAKETNERFKKLEIKGKNGKTFGIDFIKSMENEKKQGKNSIEAFTSIMDMVVGEDANYKALQAKLKNAKKADQAAILDQMANLVEGTAIGQIISDRQALMALLGIRNNVQLGKEVAKEVGEADGAVDKSHAVMQNTTSYKVEAAKNAVEFAQMDGIKGFNSALGDAAEKVAEYAKTYPTLTATMATAGTVITALSSAAIAASGALALLGARRGGLGLGLGDVADITGDIGKGRKTASVRNVRGGSKFGGFFRSGATVASGLMIAAEQRPTIEAIAEEKAETKTEQQKNAEQQFYAKAYGGDKKPTFQYAPATGNHNHQSVWAKANGAYEIAELVRKEEVGALRVERGTLSQSAFEERQAQRAARVVALRNGDEGYSGLRGMTGALNAQSETTSHLSAALGKTLDNLSPLAHYQADFQQFGQTLSEGLKAAVASQHLTVQNQIKVDLDGRIVAEQLSEYQYQELKRS